MKGNLAKHVSKIGIVLPFSRVIKQEHFLLDINSFFSPAFSLFNVVTFNNDACTSSSITTQSGARIGQCFTAEGKSFYFRLSSTVLIFLSQCTSLCHFISDYVLKTYASPTTILTKFTYMVIFFKHYHTII